jgi:hypothetical protein
MVTAAFTEALSGSRYSNENRRSAMADELLEALVVRKCRWRIPRGRPMQRLLHFARGAFTNAAEAEKFIEDFYLARGVIRPRTPEQ